MEQQDLKQIILSNQRLFVRQKKSWWQIFTDLEARNKYQLLLSDQTQFGWIVEQGGGFFNLIKRWILRSHRPLRCFITDMNGRSDLVFWRKFFWFFSDIFAETAQGVQLGSAHRRFAFFTKVYDLKSPQGVLFARIKSPLWRPWTFKILDLNDNELAVIAKKWGGLVKEGFTDADTFLIDFGTRPWKPHERAVILATALCIDFDYFERNNGLSVSGFFGGD